MKQLKWYGWLGLLVLIASTVAVALGSAWAARYFTPLMWSGYILLADAIVLRLQGRSLITDSPRAFILLLWISVLVWLMFEIYNIRLINWYYVNTPDNMTTRNIGYLWAFATIMPGLFESSDLLEALGLFKGQNNAAHHRWGDFWLAMSLIFGIAYVIIPLLLPPQTARFTFGFVWLGFFFLFEPINYRMGAPSLLRDWEDGKRRRLYSLMAGGALCGLLWGGLEFLYVTVRWCRVDIHLALSTKPARKRPPHRAHAPVGLLWLSTFCSRMLGHLAIFQGHAATRRSATLIAGNAFYRIGQRLTRNCNFAHCATID